MFHTLKMLPNDIQPGIREECMDIRYPAGETVFARQHSQASSTLVNGLNGFGKCFAG
jgi:hypothetical protein